jgi:hypothetical protein
MVVSLKLLCDLARVAWSLPSCTYDIWGPSVPRWRKGSSIEKGFTPCRVALPWQALQKRVRFWNSFKLGSFCAEVSVKGQICRFRGLKHCCQMLKRACLHFVMFDRLSIHEVNIRQHATQHPPQVILVLSLTWYGKPEWSAAVACVDGETTMHASTSTMVGCELLLARDDLDSLLLRHEPVWQLLLQDKRHRRRGQVWSRRRIQLLLLQIGAAAPSMEKRGLSEKSGWSRCGAFPFAVRRSQRKQGVVVVRSGDPGMSGTSAGCRRAEPWRRWWEARRSSPGGNRKSKTT